MPDYEVSSLKKGLQILNLLKERNRLNLTDISQELEANKTTVFRLLRTLEEMKYIIKLGKDYELHPMLFGGDGIRETIKWSKLQALCRLGGDVGMDVFVATIEEAHVVVRQVYEAESGQMVDRETRGLAPASQTAAGKAILAQLGRSEQLLSFPAGDSGQKTNYAFTEPDLFLRHLEVIKQQGYAADYEELHRGVQCIASPVFCGNKVVASIAVADRGNLMQRSEIRSLTRKVINAANEITREMNTYIESID